MRARFRGVFPGVGFMVMVPGCLPSGLPVVRIVGRGGGVHWPAAQLLLAGGTSPLEPARNLQLWIGPPVRGRLLTIGSRGAFEAAHVTLFSIFFFPFSPTFESGTSRKTKCGLSQQILQPHLLHTHPEVLVICLAQRSDMQSDPDCQTVTSDIIPADG